MQHETLRGAPFTGKALSGSVLSRSIQGACKAGGTPEAVLELEA